MARILIVDDSYMARKNLRELLTKAGHVIVAEAATGLAAVEEYERTKPDLVTMDIKMPQASGVEAIEKIVKRHPEAKVIVISILDDKRLVFDALEKGARHYVFKPVSEEKILPLIDTVLHSSL